MNKLKESLKIDVGLAAELTEKWMLKHLSEEAVFASTISDPVSYYKWPLTLIARGKRKEASLLIAWINKHCLTEEGDYLSIRSGFHKEFHFYSTLWVVIAAIKLGDNQLVEKLFGFILKFHNKQTGGLATFPALPDAITEDPVSTAFLGMAACELNDKELAINTLHYFETIISQPIEDNKLWIRLRPDGSLIKSIPLGAAPKTYVIELGLEQECYYFLGAACYFIARYIEIFDNAPFVLAHKYADLLERAGSKALGTIWAAKVAPGCMALYSITGDERFFNLAKPVVSAVMQGQGPDGYWIKSGKPWVTVSAEQCYWLTDINKRL
jgi:hypothetical protein